jgi:hypothetical protein
MSIFSSPLKPSGYFTIQKFYVVTIECMHVICMDLKKKLLFLYTVLTNWLLQPRWSLFTVRDRLNL